MKCAVIGPVSKDVKQIDDTSLIGLGGIPFYIGNALQALGAEVTAFLSYGQNEHELVKKYFQGIKINHIPVEKTLLMTHKISLKNPDYRETSTEYAENRIHLGNLNHNLKGFNVIFLGPLFNENISKELFEVHSDKNLILNNFGMFNYAEKGKWVYKHPEKLLEVVKHLNFLILDEEEVKFVTNSRSAEDAFDVLKEHGLKNAAITNGSKGSKIFMDKKIYEIPAFKPRKIIDPTGAGDTYVAGLMKGLELFTDPQKAGEFAAMTATMRLENKGPFNKTTKDVLERLQLEMK